LQEELLEDTAILRRHLIQFT